MRQTTLHRTTLGLLIVFICAAVVFGILRNTVTSRQNGHDSHQHTHNDGHETGHDVVQAGAALFKDKGCIRCHHPDSTDRKAGPGLQGLFRREKLPASGRPVNPETVRKQLRDPYANMPSYAERLSQQEEDRIIAYLKTL